MSVRAGSLGFSVGMKVPENAKEDEEKEEESSEDDPSPSENKRY